MSKVRRAQQAIMGLEVALERLEQAAAKARQALEALLAAQAQVERLELVGLPDLPEPQGLSVQVGLQDRQDPSDPLDRPDHSAR